MKIQPFALLTIVLACGFMPLSCSDESYDPLIEEYNENFTVETDTDGAQYSVNDENFDAYKMLRDLYTISHKDKTVFSIVGPQDGASYSWSLSETVSGDAVSLSGVDLTDRTFSLSLSSSPLEVQLMYTISLSVTNSAGTVFTDSGRVWIEAE